MFMNMKSREPNGTIEAADYERARDDLKARLEATTGPDGQAVGDLGVQAGGDLYKSVKNVAPDLIVHFGALAWRSIGGVGITDCFTFARTTLGPTTATMRSSGRSFWHRRGGLSGEVEGARLIDIAPTLLELSGTTCAPSMQGRSLVSGMPNTPPPGLDENQVIRDRLSGLGYIA